MLDGLGELNQLTYEKLGDPETQARIAQYEMAFRMQSSVPELTDISKEPASTYELYGEEARKPGRSRIPASWRGGWRSAACGSCRSIIADGTSTATCPESCPASARTWTSRC